MIVINDLAPLPLARILGVDASGIVSMQDLSEVFVAAGGAMPASAFYAGDWGAAITAASAALSAAGGGVVALPPGTLTFTTATVHRGVVLEGSGEGATCLKQSNGANRDFIVSESFASLEGGHDTVASNAAVPSFFGLRHLRIDGSRYRASTNTGGNTSGRGVAFYGAAIIMDDVLVYECAGGGIFTEYSSGLGSSSWRGQEEGRFGSVTVRDNGGPAGWLFRGPHNSVLSHVIANYNDGWGFRSEGLPYDGGIDYIGAIHSYGNGRGVTPAADTGIYIGAIARVGMLMSDGDNVEIAASKVQVALARLYNVGGQMDGLIVSGNAVAIGQATIEIWPSSTGRRAIYWTGNHGILGGLVLLTSNADNDGLVITGNQGTFEGLDIQGLSAAGRRGIDNGGSSNRIAGAVSTCATAFYQQAGCSNNNVSLTVFTTAGQVAFGGTAAGLTDVFQVRSSGDGEAVNWQSLREVRAAGPVEINDHAGAPQRIRAIPYALSATITTGATPSLAGLSDTTLNYAAAETITAFADGLPGQMVAVVYGNSNVTLAHSTNLRLRAGLNFTPSASDVSVFRCVSAGIWREVSRSCDEVRPVSGTITSGTTPSLAGLTDATITMASATTITAFAGGRSGQTVVLVFGNGNTTLQHSSDLRLRGAVDFTPPTSAVVTVRYVGGIWREISRLSA